MRSLDAAYFDGIFAGDDDPWGLATSAYEAAKFDHTCEVLAGRNYARALEVGCAHGVLTARLLPLCDHLHAIDISEEALAKARARLGARPGLQFERMAFPHQTPAKASFDLVMLSEVAYYWSDADLALAAQWLRTAVIAGGHAMLVHYTGQTDYPKSGDSAVAGLWSGMQDGFHITRAERREGYRLDLWSRS